MVMDGDGCFSLFTKSNDFRFPRHLLPLGFGLLLTPSFQLCFGTDKQVGLLSGPRLVAPAAIGQKSLTQRLAQSSTAS